MGCPRCVEAGRRASEGGFLYYCGAPLCSSGSVVSRSNRVDIVVFAVSSGCSAANGEDVRAVDDLREMGSAEDAAARKWIGLSAGKRQV